MAITNAIMQMRRGYEADFNPSKMRAGEWAVSLDTKYVRMCFAPNVCVRMATYEAFEADMAQIRQILSTCETIQDAVEAIQTNVQNIEVVVEDYRDSASASAITSESYAKGGTGSRTGENTDNSKYYSDTAKSYKLAGDALLEDANATLEMARKEVSGYNFYVDLDDGHLYCDTESTVRTFGVDDNGNLYVEVN